MCKICQFCHKEKELSSFPINNLSPDQLNSDCVSCIKYFCDNRDQLTTLPETALPQLYCFECRQIKYINQFLFLPESNLGFEQRCNDCYEIHRASLARKILDEKWAWYREIKSNPCVDCGKQFHTCCMEFDHIPERGKKIASICDMVRRRVAQKKLLAEIAKCDLVCIMCHQHRTYQQNLNKFGAPQNRKIKPYKFRNINLYQQFRLQPCYLCRQHYPLYNMEADHIDSCKKEFTISHIIYKSGTIFQTELAKCQPICSICHRLKTFIQRRVGIFSNSQLKTTHYQLPTPESFYYWHPPSIIDQIFQSFTIQTP